ncbi:unnamed protein product [Urochloa humidicola]
MDDGMDCSHHHDSTNLAPVNPSSGGRSPFIPPSPAAPCEGLGAGLAPDTGLGLAAGRGQHQGLDMDDNRGLAAGRGVGAQQPGAHVLRAQHMGARGLGTSRGRGAGRGRGSGAGRGQDGSAAAVGDEDQMNISSAGKRKARDVGDAIDWNDKNTTHM